MLRHIATIFLLLAFSVQILNRTVIVLDYYANTAAFARNCENKAHPMMHCNGKCQMMKKLKEEDKKDQQNPERKSENKNDVISSASFFASISVHKQMSVRVFPIVFTSAIAAGTHSDIFHPPAFA